MREKGRKKQEDYRDMLCVNMHKFYHSVRSVRLRQQREAAGGRRRARARGSGEGSAGRVGRDGRRREGWAYQAHDSQCGAQANDSHRARVAAVTVVYWSWFGHGAGQ